MANEAAAEAVSKENDRIGLEPSFRSGIFRTAHWL